MRLNHSVRLENDEEMKRMKELRVAKNQETLDWWGKE